MRGITYKKQGDRVSLEMSEDDWLMLTFMLGCGIGAAIGQKQILYLWLDFVNRLNATNPAFTPYAIPPEFAPKAADLR